MFDFDYMFDRIFNIILGIIILVMAASAASILLIIALVAYHLLIATGVLGG